MKRLFGRFMCWIGIHDWEVASTGNSYLSAEDVGTYLYAKKCLRPDCGLWGLTFTGLVRMIRPNNGQVRGLPVAAPVAKTDMPKRYLEILGEISSDGCPADKRRKLVDELDSIRCSMPYEEHKEVIAKLNETDPPRPVSIIFFPNGTVAVTDQRGQQISKFQGVHGDAVRKLAEAGYDYKKLSCLGRPLNGEGKAEG